MSSHCPVASVKSFEPSYNASGWTGGGTASFDVDIAFHLSLALLFSSSSITPKCFENIRAFSEYIVADYLQGLASVITVSSKQLVFCCLSQESTMDSDSSHAGDSQRVPRQAPLSRRYTTMEGWREARSSVHAAAGIGFRILAPSPQFDPDVVLDDDTSIHTRTSKRRRSSTYSSSSSTRVIRKLAQEGRNSIQQSIPENPFDDSNADLERYQSPFDDSAYPAPDPESDGQRATSPPPTQTPVDTPPEEPYHVFGPKQKWFVVITIGMAGLFSGLSSNIYFPSLDAIAKVRAPTSLSASFCHC